MRGAGVGRMGSCCLRVPSSTSKDEKSSGDRLVTEQCELTHVNCMLKNGYVGELYVPCILSQLKHLKRNIIKCKRNKWIGRGAS